MEKKFVHLHVHTEYSLSDGLTTIKGLMQKAIADHMPALAITDLNNLYGAVKFYREAMKSGIKPIIGADVYIENDALITGRVTLLCQSNAGYLNLLKLISKSYLEGQDKLSPTIKSAWLQELGAGLILIAGEESDIGQALKEANVTLAESLLSHWKKAFPNAFYLEIRRIRTAFELAYTNHLLPLASQLAIPIIASNDVRFLSSEDFEAHEARVCINEGTTLQDSHRQKRYTDQQFFRSQAQMHALFKDLPTVLHNTVQIAKRCNVYLNLGQTSLPHFPVPPQETIESHLSKMAQLGLEARLKTRFDVSATHFIVQRKAYDDRLQRELAVIKSMGFAGYFLIVADFTKWAKENFIPVGPGRGSGPGSLVAFALNITDLDPLAFELLFERFLNPERVSMPDFDIDFCIEGRDRVIEYVMHTHGRESVAQITTYGTMAAKAVVRDVGRVLALGYGFVDKIAKLIPFELGITLEKALKQEPLLNERYQQEEEVKNLIDLALKLEGITRNVGTHAGGIVIAPGKLTDFVPLYCEPNSGSHLITQYDKDDVEAVGLVKFDFLGLKTLTIIDRALQQINAALNEKVDINLIPLNDPATFSLLKACQSTAVFQLESHGMRDLIKRLQPDCFEDLIALVALFRPGPLQSGMVDDFINRKHGRAKVTYPHPLLEPILKPTYGVIVYQEQVMQIAQALAGYTLGSADILRRAMGKKKPEEMAKQREIFLNGAVANGVKSDIATGIFDLMEKFAAYGFNKSHSASYALIAYQTAWLKTHYAAKFMAAVLSSDMDRTEKIISLLNDCQTLKLTVIPPHINQSDYFFKPLNDREIMYGLGAIKGVGEAAIENIIKARQKGPFIDLFDFCQRVDLRKANKRVLEGLIKSGCFDLFGEERSTLLATLAKALLHAEQSAQNDLYGQHDLLGAMGATPHRPAYLQTDALSDEIKLQGEKDTLGFYLSGHPLDHLKSELNYLTTSNIANLDATKPNAKIAGLITNIRVRQTKRGDRIGIFTLDDSSASIEVVCFAETFQKFRHLLIPEQIIIAEGEISIDDFNQGMRMVCKEISSLNQMRERMAKCLQVNLSANEELDLIKFDHLLNQFKGNQCPVTIRYAYPNARAEIRLGKKWSITPHDKLLTAFKKQLKIKEIKFVYTHEKET